MKSNMFFVLALISLIGTFAAADVVPAHVIREYVNKEIPQLLENISKERGVIFKLVPQSNVTIEQPLRGWLSYTKSLIPYTENETCRLVSFFASFGRDELVKGEFYVYAKDYTTVADTKLYLQRASGNAKIIKDVLTNKEYLLMAVDGCLSESGRNTAPNLNFEAQGQKK